MESRNVLVFCAHSDDQAFGAGGYIATLSKENANIRTIICSFGEQSHPHLRADEIRKIRVIESKNADRMLGGNGVMFIGLREGRFLQDINEHNRFENVANHIRDFNPDIILTHSSDDPHPDHRAVNKLLMLMYERAGLKCEVFTFDVWNLFNLTKRRNPKLVVNITQVFKKKLDALDMFRSQRHALFLLLWSVYTKAIFWGIRSGNRYAEVYYKVR